MAYNVSLLAKQFSERGGEPFSAGALKRDMAKSGPTAAPGLIGQRPANLPS